MRSREQVVSELDTTLKGLIAAGYSACRPLQLGEELKALMDRVTMPEFRASISQVGPGSFIIELHPMQDQKCESR